MTRKEMIIEVAGAIFFFTQMAVLTWLMMFL